MADEIVLKYTPANEGDHLRGVPQRDLTAADMENIGPDQLRNMTVPGPSGKPMYTPPKAEKHAHDAKGDKA